jgi:hypothetical protein
VHVQCPQVQTDQRPERVPVTGPGARQRPLDVKVSKSWIKAMRRTHRHTVTPGYDRTDEFAPGPGSDTDEGVDQAPAHRTAGRVRLMGAPFVWFDLTTSGDGDGMRDFYAQLFGWTIGPGVGTTRAGLSTASNARRPTFRRPTHPDLQKADATDDR